MTTPPVWLSDTTEIIKLCNWFIDRLNEKPASARQKPVGITLNEKPSRACLYKVKQQIIYGI